MQQAGRCAPDGGAPAKSVGSTVALARLLANLNGTVAPMPEETLKHGYDSV